MRPTEGSGCGLAGQVRREHKSCRDAVKCELVLCPAYGGESFCWRLDGALCQSRLGAEGRSKWELCLACPVFRMNAEADPQGWGHFVEAELPRMVRASEEGRGRRRLEEEFKQLSDDYRRLFEGCKDMIFVHSGDGVLKTVNQACVEMLGYGDKEELLCGASAEGIYVNPIHRKVFQEQVDRHGFVKDFETTFKKKDGAGVHCLVSGTAVRDRNGRITGYEAVCKDITARMDDVRRLRRQHRELSLLHSVAASMNVTGDLDEILRVALKKVLEALNLSTGAVFLANHENSDFVLKAQQGLEQRQAGGRRISVEGRALAAFSHRRDRSMGPERGFEPFSAVLTGEGCGPPIKLLCFLISARGKAFGFFALQAHAHRALTDPDRRMLASVGNFLGSAIENANLARTVHKHREELKKLTARLFRSQEEERKGIARELHDEAGQALTGISLALETIARDLPPGMSGVRRDILEVKNQIGNACREMRSISHRLHPVLLSDLGLEPALEYGLERISKHSGVKIDFRMTGFEERMDPDIETTLYRISLEAANNAIKHSGAGKFRLLIIRSFPNIIFLAEDDGVGFDADEAGKHGQGLGLLSMRERAAAAGGVFSLRTQKGRGTRIRIEIPANGASSRKTSI